MIRRQLSISFPFTFFSPPFFFFSSLPIEVCWLHSIIVLSPCLSAYFLRLSRFCPSLSHCTSRYIDLHFLPSQCQPSYHGCTMVGLAFSLCIITVQKKDDSTKTFKTFNIFEDIKKKSKKGKKLPLLEGQ